MASSSSTIFFFQSRDLASFEIRAKLGISKNSCIMYTPELEVTDSLHIKGMFAFPVDVVHGVSGWLLDFNVGAVHRSQTLWHAMSTMEAQNQILCLGLRKRHLDIFWTQMDGDGFACLSDHGGNGRSRQAEGVGSFP